MNEPLMGEQFDLLRANIEAALELPAAIVVSSACRSDGKSVTSYGLANSFAASGYRTALIDANHLAPTLDADRAPVNVEQFVGSGPTNFDRLASEGTFHTISFVKESLRRNTSRPALRRAIDACRDSYQVVIIDAAPLGDSNFAMMLANQVDGIIMTVREGRAIKRADHDLIKAIAASDLPLIGTVTISAALISNFGATIDHRRTGITTLSSHETQARARVAAG